MENKMSVLGTNSNIVYGKEQQTKTLHCNKCGKEKDENTIIYKCSRCMIAAYCSKECQAAEWTIHKKNCKSLGNKRITNLTQISLKRQNQLEELMENFIKENPDDNNQEAVNENEKTRKFIEDFKKLHVRQKRTNDKVENLHNARNK